MVMKGSICQHMKLKPIGVRNDVRQVSPSIWHIEHAVVTWFWKSYFTVHQTPLLYLRAALTVTASVVFSMCLKIWSLLASKKMTISDLALLGIEEINIPSFMRIK